MKFGSRVTLRDRRLAALAPELHLFILIGMTFSPVKLRAAAIMGLLGVALGAFGAHLLEPHWIKTLGEQVAKDRLDWWQTGIFYHITHSIVLLVLAFGCPEKHQARVASWCFVIGVNIFSGTLYLLALTGLRWMGAIVPIGGTLLLIGWLLLAIMAGRRTEPAPK
jgi:uncharacterized membrane protein YgdD (TMEM256/DUF423 family)